MIITRLFFNSIWGGARNQRLIPMFVSKWYLNFSSARERSTLIPLNRSQKYSRSPTVCTRHSSALQHRITERYLNQSSMSPSASRQREFVHDSESNDRTTATLLLATLRTILSMTGGSRTCAKVAPGCASGSTNRSRYYLGREPSRSLESGARDSSMSRWVASLVRLTDDTSAPV